MSDSDPSATDGAPAKRPLLQIIIIILLALCLAGLGYQILAGSKTTAEKKGDGHEAETAEKHQDQEDEAGDHEEKADAGHGAAPAARPTVKVTELVIKLKDVEDDHYARMAFDLETKNEPGKAAVTAALPKIRDAITMYVSDLSVEELRGSDGLKKLKSDLLQKIEELAPHKVTNLYISDFVVQ